MSAPTTQTVRKSIQKTVSNVACRAYRLTDQADLTDNSWNKINLNAVSYDLGGNFDTTNFKFVVPVTGLYKVVAKVHFTAASVIANKSYGVGFYVNGALKNSAWEHIGSSTDQVTAQTSDEIFLHVNDYIEMYADPIVGASTVDVLSGENFTSLSIRLITKEGIRQ